MKISFYFSILLLAVSGFGSVSAQQPAANVFKVIPLGVKGGLDESNLSAYMIAPEGSEDYICADAGTLRHGIDVAIAEKSLSGTSDQVLKTNIKGYLVSHPHLDHVAGLIINSPEDSPKSIYALPSVIDVLRDKYFTWKAWANFTNEGELPRLNKYTYSPLQPGRLLPLKGTAMQVTPYVLSHTPGYESTAFLIGYQDQYILYLGDTGADETEKSSRLEQLWAAVTPLLKKKQLKAIMIEVSFMARQPENLLFGHLNPRLLMAEMDKLAAGCGTKNLQQVPLVITHTKVFGQQLHELGKELEAANRLHLKLLFPEQGKTMKF